MPEPLGTAYLHECMGFGPPGLDRELICPTCADPAEWARFKETADGIVIKIRGGTPLPVYKCAECDEPLEVIDAWDSFNETGTD